MNRNDILNAQADATADYRIYEDNSYLRRTDRAVERRNEAPVSLSNHDRKELARLRLRLQRRVAVAQKRSTLARSAW